jgi:hypothetical protein
MNRRKGVESGKKEGRSRKKNPGKRPERRGGAGTDCGGL